MNLFFYHKKELSALPIFQCDGKRKFIRNFLLQQSIKYGSFCEFHNVRDREKRLGLLDCREIFEINSILNKNHLRI